MQKTIDYLRITDRLSIYQRPERDSSVFYLRARIQGRRGYVIRSTGTANESKAREIALETYYDLNALTKQGIAIGSSSFAKVYEKFAAAMLEHKSAARQHQFEVTSRRYLIPYFGKMAMETINEQKIKTYFEWRIAYYATEAVTEEQVQAQKRKRGPKPATKDTRRRSTLKNIKKPSLATLKLERGIILEVLKYAAATGHIGRLPAVEVPKTGEYRTARVGRRDHFTRAEMTKLHAYLRKSAAEFSDPTVRKNNGKFSKEQKGAVKPHALHRYQRTVLRYLVLILCNTGLRIGEALKLKWSDLHQRKNKDGYQYLYLTVRDGKTGAREVICKRDCYTYFRELKDACEHTADADFIFQNRDGTALKEPGITFKKVLRELAMLTGPDGNRRSLYSLRHTYITNELELGEASIYTIADNAGTSIQYIERHYAHTKVHTRAKELAEKAFGSKDVTNDMSALFPSKRSKS